MTAENREAPFGQLCGRVVPGQGFRATVPDGCPGIQEGDYRVGWVGRPRVLCARLGSPPAFAHWLLGQWPATGWKCLANCGGSWGLWVEDIARQQLWLATDRFAATPVFYAAKDGQLVVANSLGAILAEVPNRPHDRALIQYLVLRIISGEDQFIDGVKRILPGQCLSVDCAGTALKVQAQTYWRSPIRNGPKSGMSVRTGVALIEEAMAEEIAGGWDYHAAWAGEGTGLLFSGGVDSRFLLSQLTEEQQSHLELATFGFQGKHSPDVASAQEAVSSFKVPLRWEPVILNPQDAVAALDRVILQTMAPVDHPNFLAREAAYRNLTARGAKTVMAGEGADTLLGGTWNVSIQKMVLARRLYSRMGSPDWLLTLLSGLLPQRRREQLTLIRETNWQKVCLLAKSYVPVDWLEAVLASRGGLSVAHFPYHAAILDRIGEANATHGVYELALMTNMVHELLAEQKMAASAGTHQWSPYLDGRFPECTHEIPAQLKTRRWKAKYLLYRAAEGRLPPAVLNRPKSGSPAPLVSWFSTEGSLGGLLETVTATNSFCGQFLESRLLRPVVERFRASPNSRDAEILWVLVNLERWAALVLHEDHGASRGPSQRSTNAAPMKS
jgi:asparagine synthase (glutamine-hydrolysing)